MKLTKKVLITIGREYGSGGREIAEILSKDLEIPLFLRFDIFRDDGEIERMTQIDDRGDDPSAGRVREELLHEGAVDLDGV